MEQLMQHVDRTPESSPVLPLVPDSFSQIGVGPTDEFTLRVSAACLTLFLINRPDSDTPFLLLERVSKVNANGEAQVKLQPIGGIKPLRFVI